MCTFYTIENDGVLAFTTHVSNSIDQRFKNGLLVVGGVIEFVAIASHGFLETARSAWFVDLDQLFVWIELKERTDVVWFG